MRILWVLLLVLTGAGQAAPRKRVLILGIDGCRPDALEKAKAPNLRALMEGGAWSLKAQTGEATVSGPSWSSLLTGVWMAKHNVRDNKFTNPRFDQYPHLFARLKSARAGTSTASIVHWAPINKSILGDADFTRTHDADAKVARDAAILLREKDPDAVFLHFDDVDQAGHKGGYGPAVAAYLKAIEQVDEHVGTVLSAMRGRKASAAEDWLVLVSTDHGGTGKDHGQNIPEHRTTFYIASGPSAARGEITPPPGIVDVAPTALAHLGVAIDPSWRLDGKPVGLK